MRSKSQTAWEAAARWAALAQEADNSEERECYARLHDAGPRLRKDAGICLRKDARISTFLT